MIFRLFRRAPQERIIASLYGTIVAQARARFLPDLPGPGYDQRAFRDGHAACRAAAAAAGAAAASPAREPRPGGIRPFLHRTWTTACAKWAWAISRFRERCVGSARPSMAGKRPTGRRSPSPDEQLAGGGARAQCICRRARAGGRRAAGGLCARGRLRPAAQDGFELRASSPFPIPRISPAGSRPDRRGS